MKKNIKHCLLFGGLLVCLAGPFSAMAQAAAAVPAEDQARDEAPLIPKKFQIQREQCDTPGSTFFRNEPDGTVSPCRMRDVPALAAAFVANGTRVAAIDTYGKLRIWPLDASAGAPIAVSAVSKQMEPSSPGAIERFDAFTAADFSGKGDRVAVVTGGEVLVFEIPTEPTVNPLVPKRSIDRVASEGTLVRFSPDGRYLAVFNPSGRKNSATIFGAQDGKRVSELAGHKEPIVSVSFSSNGQDIATASLDDTVRIWSVATGKVKNTLQKPKMEDTFRPMNESDRHVALSPDGKNVFVNGQGYMYVQKIKNGQIISKVQGGSLITTGAFSSDGMKVIVAGGYLSVTVMNTDHFWKDSLSLVVGGGFEPPSIMQLSRGQFSPNDKRALAIDNWGAVYVWDLPPPKADIAKQINHAPAGMFGFGPSF